MHRLVAALLILGACASAPRTGASERLAGCYALTVTPSRQATWYFEGVPATVELTDVPLVGRDTSGVALPSPYFAARSWPRGWSQTDLARDRDPVQGWVETGWRFDGTAWARSADARAAGGLADSVRIGLGPITIAFGGINYTVRPTRGGFSGRATWFTDASSDGVYQRSAPLTGERVACPTERAYLAAED